MREEAFAVWMQAIPWTDPDAVQVFLKGEWATTFTVWTLGSPIPDPYAS